MNLFQKIIKAFRRSGQDLQTSLPDRICKPDQGAAGRGIAANPVRNRVWCCQRVNSVSILRQDYRGRSRDRGVHRRSQAVAHRGPCQFVDQSRLFALHGSGNLGTETWGQAPKNARLLGFHVHSRKFACKCRILLCYNNDSYGRKD